MKKKDIILIISIIIAAAVMFFIISRIRSESGNTLVVSYNGETYGEYSLSEDQTIEIKTELGFNVLKIEDGYAFMEEADCPDKYCIEQGKISKVSETIVCLPHKIVAEVISNNGSNDSDVNIITN